MDALGDAAASVGQLWRAAIIVFFLSVVTLYLRAYFRRYVEYLKARDGIYLDRGSLDLIRRVAMAALAVTVFLVALLVSAMDTQIALLQDVFNRIVVHLPSAVLVTSVLFMAALLRRIIHRYILYMRGQLPTKPQKAAAPQTLTFLELFLKYFVSALAAVFAFFGGLALLPSTEDVGIRQWLSMYVLTPMGQVFDPQTVGFVLVTLTATYLAANLASSILEDYKRRTSKFTPRVINVFMTTARGVILSVGILAVVLIFVFKVLSPSQQIIVGIALLTLVGIAIVVSYDSIKNALAGIVLMNADELEEGERVKIGNDLVCDVIRMDLTVTQVRNLRGEVIFIPNRELLNTEIMNFSRSKSFAVPVEVRVGFDIPHWRVREILLKAADKTVGILDEPKPQVYGKDINGESITYQLWAYMENPREMKAIKSELIWNLQELFHQAGVKALVSR